MKNRRIVLVGAVFSLLASGFVMFTFFGRGAHGEQKAPRKFSELPPVVSKVPALEVIHSETELRNGGMPNATATIRIKNNSDRPILAVTLESGDDRDASGTNLNGFHDGDVPPSEVAKPHETFEMDFPMSSVRPGRPIRVAAVIYADGTEEGDTGALQSMRKQREYRRNNRKEGPKQ